MPVTVSFINMKGGVGKTTLAFNLACFAAQLRGLRVLAVDLDPQANLSQYVLGEMQYLSHITANRPTTAELFEQVVGPNDTTATPQAVTPSELILGDLWASYRRGRTRRITWTPDLVASRLELSRALRDPAGKEAILARFLADHATDYDLIVIDCPPTESILTTAAYRASRYVVVPVRPEFLATVGFPMLARSLDEFRASRANQLIDIAGIVFNGGARTNVTQQQLQSMRDVRAFAERNDWHVLEGAIHRSESYPNGSRSALPIFATPYARGTVVGELSRVGDELLERVGL